VPGSGDTMYGETLRVIGKESGGISEERPTSKRVYLYAEGKRATERAARITPQDGAEQQLERKKEGGERKITKGKERI